MSNRRAISIHIKVHLGGLVLLAMATATPVEAQGRPGPSLELAAGWVGFVDDARVDETLLGGSARWYWLPRVSLGPEVVFISGRNHSHLVATGNVTFDLLAPGRSKPRRVTPFVVVGGGAFQTRERFPIGGQFPTRTFTSTEGAFTAGGGVRAFVGDRVTVGVDARIGWELHARVNGLVGVRLGG